eukprot:SM000095S24992  [mRNA]  locus=s95:304463:304964:- [translate_table: standard]
MLDTHAMELYSLMMQSYAVDALATQIPEVTAMLGSGVQGSSALASLTHPVNGGAWWTELLQTR